MIEPSAFSSDTTQRSRSDGELIRQKTYLDELFELAPDAVVLTTLRNPKILRINREFTRMFGYTPEEAIGKSHRDLVTPHGLEPVLPEDPDLLAGRKVEWEIVRRRKDGTLFHAHITGKRIQLSGDEDAAYLIFRDITARKQAEAMFEGEKRLLEIIAAGSSLKTTLDALCRLAEELDRDSLTSILLLDRKADRLRNGAGPSLPPSYVKALDGAAVGLRIGPCAAAAHLGEQVISLDIAADQRWSDEIRALASAHGLGTCWSTPIKSSEGRVLGTFAIYPSEPVRPTNEERSRIEQLSHLASIAIERADSIEALHESEKRYERAMLAAEAGFWDWDVLKDEFYVSPRLLEMCGFPPGTTFAGREDFIRRAPFYPEDRHKWQQAVQELFASGGSRVAMDLRSIHDGETVWNRLDGMCFRDDAGRVVRWTGSATDVTESKRGEEALRRSEAALRLSEERYALALEASEEGHFDIDLQAGEIFVSARVNEIYGFPAQAKTLSRSEFLEQIPFHPEDRPRVLAEVNKHDWNDRNLQEIQCRIVPRPGETRWIRSRAKVVRDAQGRARRRVGVLADITERKRAEEELRSRQELLDLAQWAARAVAFEWRVDAAKGENRWSPELEAMYGIPAGSYDGTYECWKKLIHPEDWPNVRAAIKLAQQTGNVDAEYRVVHRDGTTHWLHAKGRMLFDSEHKPVRLVGFMLDVTDRHLGAEELQRMERQLRQAQRLEALGTLAGGIAHDFNNLLGAILGYGEMALRNVRAGSRLRRDIENMMIAGERGHALVERILAFSRSGVGERVAVHVEGVVRETLALLAAKLPAHIVIERRLHGGSAAVMGDPTQIHQVLMNLVTNAMQAMPSGGTLRVSLDRIDLAAPRVVTTGSLAAREYVAMEVSDSGSGIPSEIFEKIFDPFFTTKEVGVGTGLGLSLVHGIVTGLGGAIDVETTVGEGSTFKVYLPLAGEVTVPVAPKRRLVPKAPRTVQGRILVIDDEEPLVRLVTETLAESGYLPFGFTSSTKALQAFLEDPKAFEAVITDESMRGMSGSDLIPKMRAVRPTIPILLVSGYLGTAVIERAREAGATDVLKKPLSASVLRKALERVLPPAKEPRTKVPQSSNRSGPAARPPRKMGSSHANPGPVRRSRSSS